MRSMVEGAAHAAMPPPPPAAVPLPHMRGGGLGVVALLLLLSVLLFLASATPAHALQPDEILADPKLEQRARGLSAQMRCLVCQNQSIDDSDAPLARDLRILIRDRLKAGDSDAEVVGFLVDRYGEFVLLKPRLHPTTLLLWLGPFAVLGLGLLAVLRMRWRREAPATEAALSEDEKRRLEALVEEKP